MPKRNVAPRRRKTKSKLAGSRSKSVAIRVSSFRGMHIQQAAAILSAYLRELGYDPVLTGRGCAAIYSRGVIKTKSLDFVVREYAVEEMEKAMAKIGFRAEGLRVFAGKSSPYDIVFAPPPLAVGDAVVGDVRIMKTARGPIKMLTPTDCVRQRLSVFYRWGDKDAFDDAVRVARRHKIDMNLVKRWSEWEWAGDRFEEFFLELKARK